MPSYSSPVSQPTPSPYYANPQQIQLGFGPRAPAELITQWYTDIIQVLVTITKIEEENWVYLGADPQWTMTGESYVQATWQISTTLQTNAKLLALKKWLDYDNGEQFKTLFNTLMADRNPDVYIINYAGGLVDIADQQQVLDLKLYDWWSDVPAQLGWGALYVEGVQGSVHTTSQGLFCDNTVRADFHVEYSR